MNCQYNLKSQFEKRVQSLITEPNIQNKFFWNIKRYLPKKIQRDYVYRLITIFQDNLLVSFLS